MKLLTLLSLTVFVFVADAAPRQETIQCWGKRVRQTASDPVSASAHFVFKIAESETAQGGAELRSWIGDVRIYGTDGNGAAQPMVSYYSQFNGKNMESSLAPRARKYPDSEFFRFKKFKESASSYHDGGGMNGELVIEKSVFQFDDTELRFKAHYVFQSGDHMGGTLDMTCGLD